jgi:hypothetical protein
MFSRAFLLFLILLMGCNHSQKPRSQLDQLIAPEVKNDAFYDAIYRLSSTEDISTILEIGSSSGEGSTSAFVAGIKKNPRHPTLACMEISKRRFTKLRQHYATEPQVRCYNVSSVPLTAFPQTADLAHFYKTAPPEVIQIDLAAASTWLQQDIDYLKESGVPQQGIELIRKDLGIEQFDMVLIDGSEFTGQAELDRLYGAKFILLDDTRSYKNHTNRARLLKDPQYTLLEENLSLRNGYSIFKKR